MITLTQAKALKLGQTLYHVVHKNADDTPQRWQVNGKIQTWKRNPNRVRIPVKNGLRNYDQITENHLDKVKLHPGCNQCPYQHDARVTGYPLVANCIHPNMESDRFLSTREVWDDPIPTPDWCPLPATL